MNLNGMSVNELLCLSIRAGQLAMDLRQDYPSYALALEAGIKDKSYRDEIYGLVKSYSGRAVITMENGKKYKAIGRGPVKVEGSDGGLDGYIEFILME